MGGRRITVLAAGDAAALLAFAVAGLLTHDRAVTATGLLTNAVPVLAGWFLAAALSRAYTRPRPAALVLAWLAGVSAGVLVRSGLLGHPTGRGLAVFLLVTLGTTGFLLGAWRLVARSVLR